jgi:exodeoxyribonuclease-3
MQIAAWNVNSLKVRLPQVLDWLAANPVDALCLQELKMTDEVFPLAAIQEAGYHAVFSGQKTYNGVAVLSRSPVRDVVCGIPGYEDAQKRVIAVTLDSPQGEVRLVNAYCPNGQAVDSEKYIYKLSWYEAFTEYLKNTLVASPRMAVLGDYNIAPDDRDVHDPAKWAGDILVSPREREAFQALLALGLVDSFRLFEQPEKIFSWWDYRQFSFRRNAGLRIDHILLSTPLAGACTASVVDKAPRKLEQPSDHAPVVATLAL